MNSQQLHAKPLPDPTSAGAVILHDNCGLCHAAPQPDTHPATEWPNVIERMQNYRVIKGYGRVPEPEERRMLEYLQTHAKVE